MRIEKPAATALHAILRWWFGANPCDIRLPLCQRRYDDKQHRVFVDAEILRRVHPKLRGRSGHQVRTYHGDLTGEVFRLRHRKQTVRRLPEPLGGNVVRRLIDKPLLHVGVV